MSKEKYTALILGANGLIGQEVLLYLLKNDKYKMVYAVSRKKININHPKMVHIEADIDTIEAKTKDITVDHLFCCIGTTKHKTPNKEEYYRIDHDYPVLVATLFRNKGCKTVSLVSSIGANSNSTSFYLKLKGDTERDIIGLNFESTHIFRPSLLLGKRKEKRKIEDLSKLIMPFINFFLRGNLKNYRSIKAKNVAFAMVNLALSNNNKGNHIYLSQDIKQNA